MGWGGGGGGATRVMLTVGPVVWAGFIFGTGMKAVMRTMTATMRTWARSESTMKIKIHLAVVDSRWS